MATLGPHHIPHDHKYQSRGDFENRLGYGKAKPSPNRNTLIRKGSIFSDNDSTLIGSSKGSSHSSEIPPKFDKYPTSIVPPQRPKRRRRCWPWLILIVLVLAAIAVLIAFLVKRNQSNGGLAVGNSSAVSTIIILASQPLTSTTITLGGGTIMTTVTQGPSIATVTKSVEPTTTTLSPQPTATPAAIQGFDVWRFYNGDIMMVYEFHGSIWTKQYQGRWNSPTLIASDAKPGTSVRVFGWVETNLNADSDGYGYYDDNPPSAWGLCHWTVYYVDTNSVLQEKIMDLDSSGWSTNYNGQLPVMSGKWYAGVLGSGLYQWKVSESLYFEACAWGPLLLSETAAAGYLYIDAAGGGITKLGTSFSDWWVVTDLPGPVAGSNKAITCAGKEDEIENLWLINQDNELEQWWLNATTINGNYPPLKWNRGIQYSGSLATNTTLETWSTPLTDIIFYQAPNGTLMYFSVLGEGAASSISSSGAIAAADLGTDLATTLGATTAPSIASYNNATFDAFYVVFQNGSVLAEVKMLPDPNTGITVVGAADAQIYISGAAVDCGGSDGGKVIFVFVLSFGLTLWLLL